MKPTNYIYLVGLFLILGLAGGCSSGGSDDIPTPPTPTQPTEKDYVTVSKDSLQATRQGNEVQISFTTNKGWTASSSQSWCTLSITSGEKGSVTLKATMTENTTTEERTAIITIKAGTISQKIVITQEAAEKDKLELATTSFTVVAEGKEIQIPFTTDVAWEASSDQEWCTLSKAIGEEGTHTLTVTVDKNTGYEDRTATITLKAGNVQETITISQERKYQLKVTYTDTLNDYSGADVEVKVQCNTEYEISFDANWIQQVKPRSMNEDTILFKVSKNDDTKEREAEITFFNKEKNLKETIKIRQEGKPEDTSVKPGGNIGNMEWG